VELLISERGAPFAFAAMMKIALASLLF
jgi:hypothetical protein